MVDPYSTIKISIMNYGYVKSKMEDSDIRITPGLYPRTYSLRNMDSIRDQGSTPKCVSCAMTDILNFKLKYQGKKVVRDSFFYDNRPDRSVQGMSPKDAFKILANGVTISGVSYKARSYSRLNSIELIKYSIVAFGPVMLALPVYSYDTEFWSGGSTLLGGHAITAVGYTEDTLTIRNSWGYSYGKSGYGTLNLSDKSKIIEAWCLIN